LSTDYSEDALVEQPAIALFCQLGYDTASCFYKKFGASGATLGRETTEQVILFVKPSHESRSRCGYRVGIRWR